MQCNRSACPDFAGVGAASLWSPGGSRPRGAPAGEEGKREAGEEGKREAGQRGNAPAAWRAGRGRGQREAAWRAGPRRPGKRGNARPARGDNAPVEIGGGRGVHYTARMSSMQLLEPTAAVRARYANLVSSSPHASVFHTPAWHAVIASVGIEVRYLDAGEVMIPFAIQGRGITRRAFSLPYDTVGGPVGPTDTPLSFDAIARAVGCPSVRIVDGSGTIVPGRARVIEVESHRLRLDGDVDAIRAGFTRSAHKAVRQAKRRGVDVQVRTDEGVVGEFYALYGELMRRHGARRVPRSLVTAIFREMVPHDTARFYAARVDGETAAVMIMLRHPGEAVAWSVGYAPHLQAVRPNNALIDRWICDEVDAGCRSLDLGASPGGADSRVDRFKESFGARPYTRRVLLHESAAYRALRAINRRLGR